MNTAIIITSVSVIILALISALESALNSFNRLRYEVDKKQGKRYAVVLEDLLEKEGELKASLRLAYDLFLVIAVVSLASIFSGLFTAIAIAFFGLLILTKILPMAVASYNACNCRDWCRMEIRVNKKTGKPYVLELNPIAGIDPSYILPRQANLAGMTYADLINTIVDSAAERYQKLKKIYKKK